MQKTAFVNYHIAKEEQQAFLFDVDGIPGNLISPELVSTEILVEDLLGSEQSVSLETDGITFEHHVSSITDFESNQDWKAAYDQELKSLLTEYVGAREVIIFDHTVRIDDPEATRKPARNVHYDFSPKGAKKRMLDIVGTERGQQLDAGHWALINIWRPVEHVIKTSPLGFIRPASMKVSDRMTIDLIYPDRQGQILGVAANKDHQWIYLSNMTPQEVTIFTVYDSRNGLAVGHSALDMDLAQSALPPRKSIESRTLVRF